jgi:phage terminase small subunit
MKGRKPKPAAVRALHNSEDRAAHRARELVETAIPARASLKAPAELVKAERRYWDYFAPLLAGARLLTDADWQTLADYCRACGHVDERSRRLRLALRKRDIDQKLIRLLDSQARGWIEKKTQLAGELGLTAIGRARIGWTGQRAPSSSPAPSDPGQPPAPPRSKLAELQERAASLRRPDKVH